MQTAMMTPKEAATFIRRMAETTASASQNWDNFEAIVESMIMAAMDAARAFGQKEPAPAPAEEPQPR